MDLKIGDQVQHKSGGHPMILKQINGSVAICEWIEPKKHKIKREEFELSMLAKVQRRAFRFG